MEAPVLTKKQQKAQAFRAKQKAKAKGIAEPSDLPEADDQLDLDESAEAAASTEAVGGKKRKRDDGAAAVEGKDGKGADKVAKGKGKGKTAWDEEEEGEAEPDAKKSKKEAKQRFILFVGNLGYDTTREVVQAHFKEAVGTLPQVRLLTQKAGPQPKSQSKSAPVAGKSRGIAFLELSSSAELQACLRLHHSLIDGRRINVELTAGGGGKGDTRKGKLEERKARVGTQRERRAERDAEAGVAEGVEGATDGGVDGVRGSGKGARRGEKRERPQGGKQREEGERAPRPAKRDEGVDSIPTAEGIKMRGGRRVKANTGDERRGQDRRGQGAGGAGGRGGFGGRGGGGSGGGRKWEPTGANAITVG